MIEKKQVEDLVNGFLAQQQTPSDYQLTEVRITSDNDIFVEVDAQKPLDLDFCAAISRYIESHLDREREDYALEVGSVGLTDPFKSQFQYRKHLGSEVEVLALDGKKYRGVLVDVADDNFSVDTEVMIAVEGKKRKQKAVQTMTWKYDEVKYTRYDLKV